MHFVIIGGDGVQLLGGYIPPIPPPPPPRFGTAGYDPTLGASQECKHCLENMAEDSLR